MRIRHILSAGSVRHETDDTTQALFLRNAESYFALRPNRQSRYDGWFLEDTRPTPSTFIKLIERLAYIKGGSEVEPSGVTVTDQAGFWEYGDGMKLGFQLTPEHLGLQVGMTRDCTLRIILDIRNTYTLPELGRNYVVTRVSGGVVVQYTDEQQREPLYLHIASDNPIELTPAWNKVSYPWDAGRNSHPSELYVYTLGEVTTQKVSFGAGYTPEEAQMACHAAMRLPLETIGIGISYSSDSFENSVRVAKESTERSLEWLNTQHGIYAGLPWFHQVWSRDELIAALGVEETAQADIIARYCALDLVGGELPTYIGSGTTCADGLGWLCLLMRESGLENIDFLRQAYRGIQERRGEHGLIRSGHNATWMDTIGREGYCLEIQGMYALLLSLLAKHTQEARYQEEHAAFLATIREHFWKDSYLWDKLDDASKRPNMFLAYLLQPELLSAEAWKTCFAVGIAACSTPWGGFTSLEKTAPLYQPESTGENNLSYHNGDSWFFVNNLAACALARLDTHIYKQTIQRLLESSTNEILWRNMLGCAGEIASAESGTSWGCGIQAFSAGAYLFLLSELEY